MLIQACTVELLELASSFNEDVNMDMNGASYISSEGENWLDLNKVTTKELQSIMQVALVKVSSQNQDARLGIEGFDKESTLKLRSKCKNSKLKHAFFKVISGDIFSNERMCRFGIFDNNRSERCERV